VLDHLNDRWEILLGDNIVGPYTWHKIADYILDGIVDDDTLVRLVDTENWQSLSETRLAALLFSSTK